MLSDLGSSSGWLRSSSPWISIATSTTKTSHPQQLIPQLEEDREDLIADLSLAFEPLQGALVPGELQIREGSVHIILEVLGSAVAAGTWELLKFLGRAVTGRVRRFLARRYGVRRPVSGVVVPVAVLLPILLLHVL